MGGFLLSVVITVAATSVLWFQLYFHHLSLLLVPTLSCFFGFPCLLTVDAFDEVITKYYQIEAG
jgi:hypothetical protein